MINRPGHRWRRARDGEPHDYYRLLDLDPTESDPQVIREAADKQMANLKARALGNNGEWCEQLLNRVVRAKLCLLDPKKKAQYDRRLREAEREQAKSNAPGDARSESGPKVQQRVELRSILAAPKTKHKPWWSRRQFKYWAISLVVATVITGTVAGVARTYITPWIEPIKNAEIHAGESIAFDVLKYTPWWWREECLRLIVKHGPGKMNGDEYRWTRTSEERSGERRVTIALIDEHDNELHSRTITIVVCGNVLPAGLGPDRRNASSGNGEDRTQSGADQWDHIGADNTESHKGNENDKDGGFTSITEDGETTDSGRTSNASSAAGSESTNVAEDDGHADEVRSNTMSEAHAIKRGLRAIYYRDSRWSDPVVKRTDREIDFIWGLDRPDDNVPPDFSARWEGWLRPPESGRYKIIAISDDGVRVKLAGEVLIDRCLNQQATDFDAQLFSPTGAQIEYPT